MYRRMQGFIFKAIYVVEDDNDRAIFTESHLKAAFPIIGVENDPMMQIMADYEKINLLDQIANPPQELSTPE